MAINHFKLEVYRDQRDRIWWEPDKFQQNIAQLDCTFETYPVDIEVFTGLSAEVITADLDCDHHSSIYALYDNLELFQARNLSPLTADLDCDFVQSVYDQYDTVNLFTGSYYLDVTGDLNCDFAQSVYDQYDTVNLFTGSFTSGLITADLDCDFVQSVYDQYDTVNLFIGTTPFDGDNIQCTGQNFALSMQSGLHMDLSVRPLELEVQLDRRPPMDNCVFREFTMEAYGDATYNTIVLRTGRLTLEMSEASDLTLNFEKLTLDATALHGTVASIDCRFSRPSGIFTSVPADSLDLEGETPTLSMQASTPIASTLAGTTRLFNLSIQATTPAHSSMELAFKSWLFTAYKDASMYVNGDINCVFRPLQGDFHGIKGISSYLDLDFRWMQLEMVAHTDGNNSVVITLPEFIVALDTGGIPGTETCETAEDLVFEELI